MKRLLQTFKRLRDHKVAQLPAFISYQDTKAAAHLRQLMLDNYTVKNLKNVEAEQFESYITSLPGRRDTAAEGYKNSTHQRDLSVQFEWGHNHDFGTFFMEGLMGNRHVDILAAFNDVFSIPLIDLKGKQILDIGCWTGGTSLLFAAMGADVLAIEEVNKYADCVNYLKESFEIDNLWVENRSLYSLDNDRYFDRFDIVLYSGVLYHVTDPVLSLRIIFNSLKDGGLCLLETRAIDTQECYCKYAERKARATRVSRNPSSLIGGWDWFTPSQDALAGMMTDVGFRVSKVTLHQGDRALALGIREQHVDMLRAGLSKPHIR